MTIHRPRAIMTVVILLTVLAFAGCTEPKITFVAEDASYTFQSAESLARQKAGTRYADVDGDSAREHRREALIELRDLGTDASELADLLTDLFPNDNQSVPFYTELVTVDGQEAWIVIEAWGPNGSKLEATRLWILGREAGNILYASAIN